MMMKPEDYYINYMKKKKRFNLDYFTLFDMWRTKEQLL